MTAGRPLATRRANGVTALIALAFLTSVFSEMSPVEAVNCDATGSAGDDVFNVGLSCAEPGGNNVSVTPTGDSGAAIVEYRWVSVCEVIGQQASGDIGYDCGAARTCPDPADRLWRLWGRLATGEWIPLTSQCLGAPPTAAQTPTPRVTPGLVLNAIRRIGLPKLVVHIQPQGKTL
ncbi:MAG TPA: hypothetical protein VFI97_00520, partial [Arthrobacter sp.]|nr:hypothetical protein [Arthrobacter sp.]